MQTKILLSLIVLCMSVVVSAQPSYYTATTNNARLPEKETSFTASVVPDKKTAAFGLFIFNPDQKKIELQISHKANGVLVDTVITGLQFNRRYNFEQVEDGNYLVTLISGKEKIIKKVGINTVTTRNVILID